MKLLDDRNEELGRLYKYSKELEEENEIYLQQLSLLKLNRRSGNSNRNRKTEQDKGANNGKRGGGGRGMVGISNGDSSSSRWSGNSSSTGTDTGTDEYKIGEEGMGTGNGISNSDLIESYRCREAELLHTLEALVYRCHDLERVIKST